MKKIGIDIGSLYMGGVVLGNGQIRDVQYREHQGNIRRHLDEIMQAPAYSDFDTIGITGNFGGTNGTVIDNTLAQIEGARLLLPGCRNVFAIGGETFSLIFFDSDGRSREHSINPPCAAGTGSFIKQQAERLGLSVAELSEKAFSYIAKTQLIATRCAVFAKTDIVHAMQEEYCTEAICAGLCEGIARNVLEAMIKGRELEEQVGFIGGVSKNRAIAAAMEKILGREIHIHHHAHVAERWGPPAVYTWASTSAPPAPSRP